MLDIIVIFYGFIYVTIICVHSGESYAGIYVPTLVNTIRMMNERVSSDQQINLKGFMVYLLLSTLNLLHEFK